MIVLLVPMTPSWEPMIPMDGLRTLEDRTGIEFEFVVPDSIQLTVVLATYTSTPLLHLTPLEEVGIHGILELATRL